MSDSQSHGLLNALNKVTGRKPTHTHQQAPKADLLVEKIKTAFSQLDKNGVGEINTVEVKGAMELLLGEKVADEDVEEFMNKVDTDKSGTVTLEEFTTAMKEYMATDEGASGSGKEKNLEGFLSSFKRSVRGDKNFVLSAESEKIKNEIINALNEHENPNQKCVIFQIYINRILAIDDVNQNVNIDAYLKLNWQSKYWIGKTDDEFQEDEQKTQWWAPGVEVSNAIELEKQTAEEEAYWLEIPEAGVLAYTQRYIGTVSTHMDLHQFPFDKQTLTLNFESFHWKEEDMKMIVLPHIQVQHPPAPGIAWPSMSAEVKLHDWHVDEIDIKEHKMRYEFEDRTYSQVCVSLKLARSYRYYFQKVLIVLWLIVAMSWAVFYTSVGDITGRLGITVTLFLAAVAFNFVIGSSLPKVPYNTQLDQNLLVSYSYIAATVVENIIMYQIYAAGSDANIAFIEAILGLVFGATYILYNLWWFSSCLVKRHYNKRYRDPTLELSLFERELMEEEAAAQQAASHMGNIEISVSRE